MVTFLSSTPTPNKGGINLKAGDIGLMLHHPSYLIGDLSRCAAHTPVKYQDNTIITAAIYPSWQLCQTLWKTYDFQIALPPEESECYSSI